MIPASHGQHSPDHFTDLTELGESLPHMLHVSTAKPSPKLDCVNAVESYDCDKENFTPSRPNSRAPPHTAVFPAEVMSDTLDPGHPKIAESTHQRWGVDRQLGCETFSAALARSSKQDTSRAFGEFQDTSKDGDDPREDSSSDSSEVAEERDELDQHQESISNAVYHYWPDCNRKMTPKKDPKSLDLDGSAQETPTCPPSPRPPQLSLDFDDEETPVSNEVFEDDDEELMDDEEVENLIASTSSEAASFLKRSPQHVYTKFRDWNSDDEAIAFHSSPESSRAPPGQPTLAQIICLDRALNPLRRRSIFPLRKQIVIPRVEEPETDSDEDDEEEHAEDEDPRSLEESNKSGWQRKLMASLEALEGFRQSNEMIRPTPIRAACLRHPSQQTTSAEYERVEEEAEAKRASVDEDAQAQSPDIKRRKLSLKSECVSS